MYTLKYTWSFWLLISMQTFVFSTMLPWLPMIHLIPWKGLLNINIWKSYMWNADKHEWNLWSSQCAFNLSSCKSNPQKSWPWTGFEPMTLRYRCNSLSTQLSSHMDTVPLACIAALHSCNVCVTRNYTQWHVTVTRNCVLYYTKSFLEVFLLLVDTRVYNTQSRKSANCAVLWFCFLLLCMYMYSLLGLLFDKLHAFEWQNTGIWKTKYTHTRV